MEASIAQISPIVESQPAEARIGLTSRIGNAARNMYESFRQKVDRYAAIGQTALAFSGGLAGAEIINMVDAAPAGAAGNVPTRTAEPFSFNAIPAEAQASSTVPNATSQQECITDALMPMQVTNTELKRPHNDNGATQIVLAHAVAERMPFNCLTDFNVQRHVRFEAAVGDPENPKISTAFLANTLSIDNGPLYSRGQASQVLRLPLPFSANPPTKSQSEFGVYECTPGPEKTAVKFLTEEVAVDSQTNAVLGQRQFGAVPVKKILPKPC